MPAVYSFNRSQEEIQEQLLRVFSSGGTAREQWSLQAEMLVEPVGWEALWKLSKDFCKKFEVRFPCIAYIGVRSVDFDSLSACVEVLSVQHEAVSLPESVEDVPLIELWPTMKQSEACIDAASTAEFIDLMRFFYNNLWMPWDDQDDKLLLPNTIEERMQLWSDLHNGTIPNCLARSIILLRNSAINAHDKLKELDSSLCEGDSGDDDDSLLPPNYITQCAELTARLDAHMSKWTLYERALIRNQYLAKVKSKWLKKKSQRNVVAIWQGGPLSEFEQISQHLRSTLSPEQCLTITPSAEDGLALEPEQLVVCSPHCDVPEVALDHIHICSFNGATLRSSEMRSCVLMMSEESSIRGVSIECGAANTALVCRGGTLRLQGCKLSDASDTSQSDFAQGLVAMSDSIVLIEDTTFDNFYSGIVVHKGAHVELRNCTVRNCGVGIQLYSGARVSLSNTTVTGCSEHCVRCELDAASDTSAAVEGLHINPDCIIGTGDLHKDVLVVKQDVGLM